MGNGEEHLKEAEYLAQGNADSEKKLKEGITKNRENGSHGENLIVDDYNQVIDVVDLINNSENSAIAIRLKTLFEHGITQEMVENEYFEISTGVSDKDVATMNMRIVCDILIEKLSSIPNGIIIDPSTGEVDRVASLRQAVEIGIYSEDAVIFKEPEYEKYSIHKEETSLLKKIMNSDFFSVEEKEIAKLQYNIIVRSRLDISSFEKEEKEEKILQEAGVSEEAKEENERDEKFAFLNSIEDIKFMQKAIFMSKKNYNVSDEMLKKSFSTSKDSKYYNMVIDSEGKIDINKIKELKEKWVEAQNKCTLQKYLVKYIDYSRNENVNFEDFDEINKRNVIKVLARGYFSKDEMNQKLFNVLCDNLGIKNDKDSILQATGVSTEEELEAIKKDSEINDENYLKKLSQMQINKKKSQSDKYIYDLLNDIDLTDEKGEGAEVVARLYVMYSQRGNNTGTNGLERSYAGIAESLENYMRNNKEYFSKYFKVTDKRDLNSNEKINLKYVEDILGEQKISKNVSKMLREKRILIDEKIRQLKGKNGKISNKEIEEFFRSREEVLTVGNSEKKAEQLLAKMEESDKGTKVEDSVEEKVDSEAKVEDNTQKTDTETEVEDSTEKTDVGIGIESNIEELKDVEREEQSIQLRTPGLFRKVKQIFGRIKEILFGKRVKNNQKSENKFKNDGKHESTSKKFMEGKPKENPDKNQNINYYNNSNAFDKYLKENVGEITVQNNAIQNNTVLGDKNVVGEDEDRFGR